MKYYLLLSEQTLIDAYLVCSKSLHRSRAGSHFYGTEYEIWADFGQVGNTEKKIGEDYEQLLREVFHVFMVEKIYI